MAELLDDNLVSVSILSDGLTGQVAGAAIVRWSVPPRSPGCPCPAQVYIDGQLAAAGNDPAQCELVVPLAIDPVRPAAHIQVVVVQSSEWSTDFSSLLGPQPGGGRALLRWPRTNNVPRGATVNVFSNGGSGEIDWTAPLNPVPIEWFPDGIGQWGFGLSPFGGGTGNTGGGGGTGGFGFDMNEQGPPGFGLGVFGGGQFGLDAPWAMWLSEPLAAGAYQFAVVACDELGNAAPPSPVADATIVPLPPQITQLTVAAGDAGQAVVSWQ